MKKSLFDKISQFAIPILTVSGQLVIALKYPGWGLVITLIAQPFWVYSSWKAYKNAGQTGMMVNSLIFFAITAFGVINYWFIK